MCVCVCVRVCVLQESPDKGSEVWKISKVQFVYDTSETSHFINAYNRECPSAHAHAHRSRAGVKALIMNERMIFNSGCDRSV